MISWGRGRGKRRRRFLGGGLLTDLNFLNFINFFSRTKLLLNLDDRVNESMMGSGLGIDISFMFLGLFPVVEVLSDFRRCAN